ncbi:MAG: hypothetical protein FJ297_13200 [Planctomycetes bacterium]|nr:hypothetical protein [Planctomycetota bacterium]
MNEPHEPESPSFRLARVLLLVVPLVVLVVGGYAFLTVFGGMERIAAWTRPPHVPVKGRVSWNGKPVKGAQVMTRPSKSNLRGSIGATDADGAFELLLDVGGRYEDGAYVGDHAVTVALYGPHPPATPPPLLSPAEYAGFDTTPLHFEVSRDAEKNKWKIAIEGEAPPPPAPLAGPGPGTGGGGGGPPVPSPEQLARRAIETHDADKDGRLHGSEIDAAEEEARGRLQGVDENADGYWEESEILQAIRRAMPGGRRPGGAEPTGRRPDSPDVPDDPEKEAPQSGPSPGDGPKNP